MARRTATSSPAVDPAVVPAALRQRTANCSILQPYRSTRAKGGRSPRHWKCTTGAHGTSADLRPASVTGETRTSCQWRQQWHAGQPHLLLRLMPSLSRPHSVSAPRLFHPAVAQIGRAKGRDRPAPAMQDGSTRYFSRLAPCKCDGRDLLPPGLAPGKHSRWPPSSLRND